MEQKPAFEQFPETAGSLLERLEVKVGKIGSNNPETSVSILTGLDEVTDRMAEIENEASLKQLQGPYDSITGRLRADASLFLRDLGGGAVLRKARESANPHPDRWWWFIDKMLAAKRKAAMRRSLIYAGAFVVSLVILGLLYNFFLAPDPQTIARYTHQQNAQDAMMRKDLPAALAEAEQGLAAAPNDPSLLILRGIVEEAQGSQAAADKDFAAARQGFSKASDFYVTRGQSYLLIKATDKALADAQAALQANPQAAEAYLLSGQAYENAGQLQKALDAYNKTFDVASQNKQTELEALARTKIAFLMQTMSNGIPSPDGFPSETPAK